MSQPTSILEQLGNQWQWPAYVLSACFDKANNLAFALGDGSVRLLPADVDHDPLAIQAHQGAVLSLSSAPKTGFLSGGDDGRFSASTPMARSMRWLLSRGAGSTTWPVTPMA